MDNEVKDLVLEKKEKISEWLEYLNSEDDDVLWRIKNEVFTRRLYVILYQLYKNTNNDIAKKQEELINIAANYITQRDKENVRKIVNQIKELDDSEEISNDINYNNLDQMISNIDNKLEQLKQEELKGKVPEEQEKINEQWKKEEKEFSDITNSIINNFKKSKTNDVIQKNSNDNISLSKYEYEMLKKIEEETLKIQRCDFALIVNSGTVLPTSHPNYNNGRIKIEIFDMNNNNIEIDGDKYTIKTQEQFNSIKAFVSENLNSLIEWSKKETNSYLDNNAYDGGASRKIKVKYGQLLINVDGQVTGDIGRNVDGFINYLKELIISEKNINIPAKNNDDYIENEDYKWYEILENNDFVLKISDGGVIPVNHPNYDKNRTEIEIISDDYISITKCNIKIDGSEYNIESVTLFNKIKDILNENINSLISLSKTQIKNYLAQDLLLGCDRNIVIKIGNLIININGAIKGECGEFCQKFINDIRTLIINEAN